MTDHHTNTVNARDLTSRLTTNSRTSFNVNDNPNQHTMSPLARRPRPTSSPIELTSLPAFKKSPTMSTVDTTSSSGSNSLRITHAEPRTKMDRASAEIGVGEFSKPRVQPRSRRDTHSSSRSEGNGEDFRYYGRHSNQWLFNDFSVTDSIRRGCRKVFGKEERDWFERRD